MGRFPTGVTVVTAPGAREPAGLVANAVTSLSLQPPMVLACIDRGSRTLSAVEMAGSFAVNVLGAEAEDVAHTFARKVSHAEKWAGVEWTPMAQGPRLEAAISWIGCSVGELLEGGDHIIITGHVEAVAEREGEPLLFHEGAYRRP